MIYTIVLREKDYVYYCTTVLMKLLDGVQGYVYLA